MVLAAFCIRYKIDKTDLEWMEVGSRVGSDLVKYKPGQPRRHAVDKIQSFATQ